MAAETNDTDRMGTIHVKPYQDLGSSGEKYEMRQKKKKKNFSVEVDFGEGADSADVFGRALGFRGTLFP